MTARLPKEAMSQTLRLRYYQKEHTCYCCNAYALDDIEVIQGGMNVAIVADKAFELYADGKFVGDGGSRMIPGRCSSQKGCALEAKSTKLFGSVAFCSKSPTPLQNRMVGYNSGKQLFVWIFC